MPTFNIIMRWSSGIIVGTLHMMLLFFFIWPAVRWPSLRSVLFMCIAGVIGGIGVPTIALIGRSSIVGTLIGIAVIIFCRTYQPVFIAFKQITGPDPSRLLDSIPVDSALLFIPLGISVFITTSLFMRFYERLRGHIH